MYIRLAGPDWLVVPTSGVFVYGLLITATSANRGFREVYGTYMQSS